MCLTYVLRQSALQQCAPVKMTSQLLLEYPNDAQRVTSMCLLLVKMLYNAIAPLPLRFCLRYDQAYTSSSLFFVQAYATWSAQRQATQV